jgi:hypothetical protein
MTEHEVMVAWGRPRKINDREEGDVWVYRTKFPASGFHLEFDSDGTLARVRDLRGIDQHAAAPRSARKRLTNWPAAGAYIN